jgi:hypothetical protein
MLGYYQMLLMQLEQTLRLAIAQATSLDGQYRAAIEAYRVFVEEYQRTKGGQGGT